jgi:RimJ/RimL family protein N-acetyltransferase
MVEIREIREDDAEAFLALCRRLDEETTFMMYEPGERTTTVEEQRAVIHDLLATGNSTVLVAEVEGRLAGYVGCYGGEFRRVRHVGYIVAGVLQAYASRGIGTRLFAALDDWAAGSGIRRLELTVQARNEAGIRLYRKMGFEVEGTKRRAMRVDDEWIDELYMAKLQ